jgi:UDP-glucose 4-epimerase
LTKYLITGGAGFIGSHLAEKLLEEGHYVAVIDDLSTGSLKNITHLLADKCFHFARADVNEQVVLDRIASECDVIIHLAAAVGVQLVIERPVHTIETNVVGTDAVLKAALRYGTRVLLASTSEVYGKGAKVSESRKLRVV